MRSMFTKGHDAGSRTGAGSRAVRVGARGIARGRSTVPAGPPCYIARRMPKTNQLVNKGRTKPAKKLATPGLKSGKGRKKKVAAPQRRGRPARVSPALPKKPPFDLRKVAR